MNVYVPLVLERYGWGYRAFRAFQILQEMGLSKRKKAVKYFNPKTMKPDSSQFHRAVNGKISATGQKSFAYKAVAELFRQAESMYRTLDSMSSENLSQFKAANKYLTQRQENDLIALTAMYIGNLRTQLIHDLVKEDSTVTDSERQALEMALELYKATCEANYGSLGNPRWIDD